MFESFAARIWARCDSASNMFGFLAAPCSRCSRDSFPAWRGTFCGLARCLGREYGNTARLLVNRDAAFIGLLGISLDPGDLDWKQKTCCNPMAKPFGVADDHPAILHAAAVSVCGLAAKLADDSQDEGVLRRLASQFGQILVAPRVDRAVAHLNSTSFPSASVMETLKTQEAIETRDPAHADGPTSEAFGKITSHLADLLKMPTQRATLYDVGASLGSLVYWRDAWQDRVEDTKRGRFNPFECLDHQVIHRRITGRWNHFCIALNDLPFVRHGDVIASVRTVTAQSRESFLQLREEENARKNSDQRRKRRGDGTSHHWWDNCCDCACDCGAGDTGCCDCNPCDGCSCN